MIKKIITFFVSILEKFFKTKITTLSAELFKSLLVGGLGVVINVSLFFLLTKFSIISHSDVIDKNSIINRGLDIKLLLNQTVLQTLSIQIFIHIILTSMSFLLQKYFTFKKKYNTASQIKRFLIQSFFYFLIDTFLTMTLYNLLKLPSLIAKGISVFILFFYSFISQKLWVFKT